VTKCVWYSGKRVGVAVGGMGVLVGLGVGSGCVGVAVGSGRAGAVVAISMGTWIKGWTGWGVLFGWGNVD